MKEIEVSTAHRKEPGGSSGGRWKSIGQGVSKGDTVRGLPAVTGRRYKGTEQQHVGNCGLGDWPELAFEFWI